MITGKLYDQLKFLALIGLPAVASFYLALSGIWGFPNGEQVVGTITAVDLLLGALLQISSAKYNNSDAKFDGYVERDKLPPELADRSEVVFKVNKLNP